MKKIKRGLWIVLFCLLFIELWNAPMFNSKARAEMIQLSFAGNMLFPNKLVVSSDNLPPFFISEIKKSGLIVLTPEQIRERANQKGEFSYFRFKEVHFGIVRSSVNIDQLRAVNENSKSGQFGGGFRIDFYNVFGKMFRFAKTTWIT